MSRADWQALVKRYADGRPICNCGEAYLTPCGEGIDTQGRRRNDMLMCECGCQVNQMVAKEEIAARIRQEFNIA